MPISKFEKGSGITKTEMVKGSGRDIVPELRKYLRRWNRAFQENGKSNYRARAAYSAAVMENTLNQAGNDPYADDSEPDFAKRFLNEHSIAIAELERIADASNDGRDAHTFKYADSAARAAFEAGIIYATAAFKFSYEDTVLKTKKRNEEAAEQLRENALNNRTSREAEWADWNEVAHEIWDTDISLSKNDVAIRVRRRLKLSEKPKSIAARLVRPT